MKIKIRDVVIGGGIPKICVSITGRLEEDIFTQVAFVNEKAPDLVEWRVDCIEFIHDINRIKKVAKQIREKLQDIPIIFTFRSKREGGNQELSIEEYQCLNIEMAKTTYIDCIDLEWYMPQLNLAKVIQEIQVCDIKVILSNHEFHHTPSKEEMLNRLQGMQKAGADLVKIAVMPQTASDVLALLAVTDEMNTKYAKVPVVTMAMSQMGCISRLTGELFGSSITFASDGIASAPGQLPIDDVKRILSILALNNS